MDTQRENMKLLIKDLITCSICLGKFDNPKSLPCLHTFCLNCLNNLPTRRDQSSRLPYAKCISCPQCTENCTIPAGGPDKFPSDFKAKNLIDAMKSNEYCNNHDDEFRKNTHFCIDCAAHCCDHCATVTHRDHVCKTTQEASQTLDDRAAEASAAVAGFSTDFENRLAHACVEFVGEYSAAKAEIKRHGANIKQLVSKRVKSLLRQLQSIRNETEVENLPAREANKEKLDQMKQFCDDTDRVKLILKLRDKVMTVRDLEQRADDLLKRDDIPIATEVTTPKIRFKPTQHTISANGELTYSNQPFVGLLSLTQPNRGTKRKLEDNPSKSASDASENELVFISCCWDDSNCHL